MSKQSEYMARVLNESDITIEIDRRIREVLIECFAHRIDEFGKCRWLNGNVPDFTVVAECRGKVVGHTAAIEKMITTGGKSVRTCGIANVCVTAEHRGKGVVDIILKAAMDEAREREYDIGLLFCQDHVKNIYVRTGWADLLGVRVEYLENGMHVFIPAGRHKMLYWLKISDLERRGKINLNGTRW